MKWNKYTIETTTDGEDFISSMLMDLGIEGIEIEDNIPLTQEEKEMLYIDILPELPPDEGVGFVSFYLEPEQDSPSLHTQIKIELEALREMVDIGKGTICASVTEDIDWMNNWKEFFKPFTVDDILITPSWEPVEDETPYSLVVSIDPGTAFGTGMHETTRLCISQLRKYITKGQSILDVGCGSGILSIIGHKLGARPVCMVDIDEQAIVVTHENMLVNAIEKDQYCAYVGNLIEDTSLQDTIGAEGYDIVVANILADIIILLTPVIPKMMKKGGLYITSGILCTKEEVVTKAILDVGLEVIDITKDGDWVSITARK